MRLVLIPISAIFMAGCDPVLPKIDPSNKAVFDAVQFIGMHERKDKIELKELLGIDPSKTEWCAAFVNAILNNNNIPGSESVSQYPLTARSFLQWGETVNEPLLGDIVIFPRGNSDWQGHVGFYIATTTIRGKEYYLILGGNQDNTVSLDYYLSKSALSIRRSALEVRMGLEPTLSSFAD